MRCCDCEFWKDCPSPENDLVSFQLCGTRMKRLIEVGLKEKLDGIKEDDKKERKSD